MLVSDYPMAGPPDPRLPWSPAWETLSICCHCVMAGWGNGLAVNRESRRNIMKRLDLKKINVCVTDQKQFILRLTPGLAESLRKTVCGTSIRRPDRCVVSRF
jgi:hypothetical protein